MLKLEYFDDFGVNIPISSQTPKENVEIYLEKISVNLFSTYTIHILQSVFSTVENRLAIRKPLIPNNTQPFLFATIKQTKPISIDNNFVLITETQSQVQTVQIPLSNELYTILLNGDYSTASQDLIPLSITVAFSSKFQNTYDAELEFYLLDNSNVKTSLETFKIIAYSEQEDTRLTNLLKNFGANLGEDDVKIFPNFDPNEPMFDEVLLNNKRKELILNFNEIFPFIGSYKALIKILDFFGYSNVKLKEYWRNINTSSPLYNRLIATEIAKSLTDVKTLTDNTRIANSTIYKKTNLFGLFYDITVETDEADEDGLPKVVETFRFSLSDMIIKIGALKNKLEKDFLPLSSRIVDIVGEAIYFGKISSKNWSIPCNTIDEIVNIKPKFEVVSNNDLYLDDLRYLSYLGCAIGSDLTLTNQSNLLHNRLEVVQSAKSSLLSEYTLTFTVGAFSQTETLIVKNLQPIKENWTNIEIANKLVELFRSSQQSFFLGHRYFVEPNSSTIRIIQNMPYGVGTITTTYEDVNTGLIDWKNVTFPFGLDIDVSPGSAYFGVNGAPLSYFSESFLVYFDSFQKSQLPLADTPNIYVGCPIILRNTTFDYSLENLEVTFEDLQRFSGNNKIFNNFLNSFNVDGFSDNLTINVPPFPVSNYLTNSNLQLSLIPNFPYNDFNVDENYTFENFGNENFYEGIWNVTHDSSNFTVSSNRLPILEIFEYPLILPYSGTYSIELILYSLDGSYSRCYKKSAINVKTKKANFIAWKRSGFENYTIDEYPVGTTLEDIYSTFEQPFAKKENLENFDISFHSLDMIEYYQSNPIIVPNDVCAGTNAYKLENLKNCKLENLFHIWFDMCSCEILVNEIYNISDDGYLFAGDIVTQKYVFSTSVPKFAVATNLLAETFTSVSDAWVLSEESRTFYFYNFSTNSTKRTNYFADFINLGDVTLLTQLERFKLFISYFNNIDENYFIFFKYMPYIKWRYNNLNILEPYLRIVEKSYGYETAHNFYSNWTFENPVNCYTIPYFGNTTDIKATFEIYEIDSNPVSKYIKIGNLPITLLSSTNLISLQIELKNLFKDFSFNLVYDDIGNPIKIIASVISFVDDGDFTIKYLNVLGTPCARSVTTNPTTLEIDIVNNTQEHYTGTFLYFSADNSMMNGKTEFNWKIIRHFDNYEVSVKNMFMCYLFVVPSEYTIELSISDTNGNISTVYKQSFVKIIEKNY